MKKHATPVMAARNMMYTPKTQPRSNPRNSWLRYGAVPPNTATENEYANPIACVRSRVGKLSDSVDDRI